MFDSGLLPVAHCAHTPFLKAPRLFTVSRCMRLSGKDFKSLSTGFLPDALPYIFGLIKSNETMSVLATSIMFSFRI